MAINLRVLKNIAGYRRITARYFSDSNIQHETGEVVQHAVVSTFDLFSIGIGKESS
jgi:hypothetical protein